MRKFEGRRVQAEALGDLAVAGVQQLADLGHRRLA
jgi:hypothetical protein